ncbi:hypothetical protein J6590_006526 [Homalodisca vitripennis]|nr:hypothetical protein J6590_006526 [Homalodisca vitripennis]
MTECNTRQSKAKGSIDKHITYCENVLSALYRVLKRHTSCTKLEHYSPGLVTVYKLLSRGLANFHLDTSTYCWGGSGNAYGRQQPSPTRGLRQSHGTAALDAGISG